MTHGQLKLLAGGLLAVAVVLFGLPKVIDLVGENIERTLEARLGAEFGGQCRLDAARILSSHEIEIDGLACVLENETILGFGMNRLTAQLTGIFWGGSMPTAEAITVHGLELRLGDLPGGKSGAAGESTTGQNQRMSKRLEEATMRFLAFSDGLDAGQGGAQVPAVLSRLADGGRLKVHHARANRADGSVFVSDVHAQIDRYGKGLALAIVARLGRGGMITLDGNLGLAGLRDARIWLESIPVAKELSQLLGDGGTVHGGVVVGSLSYTSEKPRGTWAVDTALDHLVVGSSLVGGDIIRLPRVRLQGTLRPNRADGLLLLDGGEWTVDEVGGGFTVTLGPILHTRERPQVKARFEAERMPLGELLSSLPDELMPDSWAAEIRGTVDLSVRFGGPLHIRKMWSLDWEGDWSRMALASGSLASQVSRFTRPFEHLLPARTEGGEPLRRIMGKAGPTYMPYREISTHLINAVVSTEDAGFFAHSGFELSELKEAVLENLREGDGRGASTITQQLAKNLFLSGERSFARKLKEAVIAWRLESDLPKEKILELYLNIAEWGPGLYGIQDASQHYFGRSPKLLRPEEAAFLASLLPSPRRYHDYYHKNGLSPARQRMVQDILATMLRMGRLSPRAYTLAKNEPVEMIACRL